MKTISQILFESTKKRVQSFSELAELSVTKGKKPKIDKYCAIGAIGCENKYIKIIKYKNVWGVTEYKLKGLDKEKKILRNAGIPIGLINQDFRSFITKDAIKDIAEHDTNQLRDKLPLHTLIMILNDSCQWTFEQIGKEIQQLEIKGRIYYDKVINNNA